MIGRERGRRLDVGEDLGLQLLGERHARLPAVEAAANAAGEDAGIPGAGEQLRRAPQRFRRRLHRIRTREARHLGQRRQGADLRLLQRRVEVDVRRRAGRRLRHLHGAQQRFVRGRDRARLVVPLGVIAHQRALVGGGVDPVDPRPAARRVPRTGGAEDQHRHAVAPGVEDRHRRVHQADVGVHHRPHHLSGGLGVAMRHGDGRLLVQAEQHLRPLVPEVIDDRIVQPAVARAGIQREIGDVERAQHRRDGVATPVLRGVRNGRRNVTHDLFTRHGCLPP